jgi:hypothetical protein
MPEAEHQHNTSARGGQPAVVARFAEVAEEIWSGAGRFLLTPAQPRNNLNTGLAIIELQPVRKRRRFVPLRPIFRAQLRFIRR